MGGKTPPHSQLLFILTVMEPQAPHFLGILSNREQDG